MESAGNLSAGSVKLVGTFHGGTWKMTVPGFTPSQPIARNDGLFVLSGTAGTYTPAGSAYTSPAQLSFRPGWNLVAATYPNPGVMTDSMFNEIEAENGSCTAADLTGNLPCSPTVAAIDGFAGGKYIPWAPAPPSGGHQSWPQSFGNRVPFTSGMFVDVPSGASPTWTPQGITCNSTNPNGTTASGGVCQ
jgi:hypothetical protein